MSVKNPKLALVGNPNSGKSTVFNSLTGSRQHIGNWPGVTVEKKEGAFRMPDGSNATVVDLPGIYSLIFSSEDERVACEHVMGGEADLFINVIDGTNLERNLYLTLLLSELKVPVVHVVTMMDIVRERGIRIDLKELEEFLGSPVVPVVSRSAKDIANLVNVISASLANPKASSLKIEYADEMEREIAALEPRLEAVAARMNVSARVAAIRVMGADPLACGIARGLEAVAEAEVEAARARVEKVLKEYPDESLANSRYGIIQGLCQEIVSREEQKIFFTQRADKVILNRWLGIPFFLMVMYFVFWITQTIGGAFIDFFDILGGTVFVDGTTALLERCGAPAFVVALLANGLGAGVQTMATFLPPIFFMFFCLAILEDSGYMARAAFVMDRLMRWLGLPGKSFVPLLVGFGCSVPAIMATRTLESKRDRFLTIFMTPFMSCGAKLPVYVVFAAAFFPENPGALVFWLYISGIVLGVLTGLLMKRTLFQGKPSHFIMELPPYHLPRMRHILLHAWDRLKIFIFRAGKVILPMVLLLGVLNTIGKDGTIGNEDSENSVLSVVGTTLTPIFEPMGVERDNWPATVSIFTGLFAKEAVVGTLTSLYGQNHALNGAGASAGEAGPVDVVDVVDTIDSIDSIDNVDSIDTIDTIDNIDSAAADFAAAAESAAPFSLLSSIKEAFATIPENLSKVFGGLLDPLGMGDVSSDEEAVAETFDTDTSVFTNMRAMFTQGKHQVFAYLLFILLYVPCIAAVGAAYRELGRYYTIIFGVYLTLLGWSVATLYYQLALGHQALWIAVAAGLLLLMFGSFAAIGKKRKVDFI